MLIEPGPGRVAIALSTIGQRRYSLQRTHDLHNGDVLRQMLQVHQNVGRPGVGVVSRKLAHGVWIERCDGKLDVLERGTSVINDRLNTRKKECGILVEAQARAGGA